MKVTLNNTIGAIFLGVSAACIVFGITIVQTYLYYCKFPKDWVLHRVSVGVLMTLATLHLTITVHAAYYYLIINYDHPSGFERIVWSFKLQALVNAVMIFFVQGLYALRVWKLGKRFSRFWPALVGFIVMGGWAPGVFVVVRSYKATSFAHLDGMKPVIYASFTATTTIDVIIASVMCYYLNKSRSSFVGTNNIILVVARYVLITGFLTSACSLSALITYAIMPHDLIFIGIDFLLPNLYINSYIAMLNARTWMNDRKVSFPSSVSTATHVRSGLALPTDAIDGILLSTMKSGCSCSNNKYDLKQNLPPKPIGVVVHRTEERHYDHYNGSERFNSPLQ